MDFFKIKQKVLKNGTIEIYPDFVVDHSRDLMVRGRSFYAVWDEARNIWSTDEYDVARLVDTELYSYADKLQVENKVSVMAMSDFSSKSWINFRNYVGHVSDNSHQLDSKVIFADTVVQKKDYASKRLNYSLNDGSMEAYDELMGTLYSEEERSKLEWAIGSIVAGESSRIQKFLVLYGEAGTGKSTILNIIQMLFDGYYTVFEAKALTTSSNVFSTEVFKGNPLVAIQHDGDLSKIEDNTKLNSIVSHEEIIINEKYKSSYTQRANCMLFMGTNTPVKITNSRSGIIRRLIDVHPTGNKVPVRRYNHLMNQIPFELGAIAKHCLELYLDMGKSYYNSYRPIDMMYKTDVFFNFVEDNYYIFEKEDGVSLKQAYTMYKEYCLESGIDSKLPMYKFREEMKSYFRNWEERARIDGQQIRNYFSGFITEKFKSEKGEKKVEKKETWLYLEDQKSLLDEELSDCLAQYATKDEKPSKKWANVTTKLKDLDTSQVHYIRVPENHIVIDFDLKNEKGEKDLGRNLEAANGWPKTYAEVSKGGQGLHLHYVFDGDINTLSSVYSEGIEIKVFRGDSSLRRKVTRCFNHPVVHISGGLPLREAKVINFESVKNEKALRTLIKNNLEKKYHPGTKPSIDFIFKNLEDAYNSGMKYDVTDLRPAVLAFAANSSNQAEYCIKKVNEMKWKSEEPSESANFDKDEIIFFDVEVFPNLFVVVWKPAAKKEVKMINPTSTDIENLLKYKLVGFNNRRYDNHILYARLMGYNNEQLYDLSQRIVNNSKNCLFGEAYNLSYTDVYDFAAKKQGLKKWEIELNIHHQELGLPWDQPVPEEKWELVADYCINDVVATEVVFNHLHSDFVARQILAKLSGLTVNDTTNQHSTRIIFGNDPKPQQQFKYTDLSVLFPGYIFENGKSYYRGEEVGEGGYVYAEPGMHGNVALLDVASMHPTSIEQLNLFGDKYTTRFSELKQARVCIKHNDIDRLNYILDGDLVPFIQDPNLDSKALSNALKIVINSVYGLTSAKFDNKFRDPRNKDNIVAKRGALFMIDLKHAVQEKGFTVAHIKTDSIKIPDATPEIIEFVMEFGKRYGYIFEHEATYDRMCLVNDAVYVARYKDGKWTATGTQFQVPYVFKTMFSHEPLEFRDYCETKSVTSALYLDMNENLPEEEHDYHFVGKAGAFCPIKPGCGGGQLFREKDGKYYAATGTKGYRWLESEVVRNLKKEGDIDLLYFNHLVDEAVDAINEYGDFEWFISDEEYRSEPAIERSL